MHSSVEKRVIHFGGVGRTGHPMAVGIPARGAQLAYGTAPDDVSLNALTLGVPASVEEAAQRLDLPQRTSTAGPVQAISIAPDSALASATIWLAGKDGSAEERRVSVGNPLVGCFDDYDFAFVTVPCAVPVSPRTSNALNWDSSEFQGEGNDVFLGWPLRLELWRGSPLPIRSHQRAPLYAVGAFYGLSDAAREFVVCTDGRRYAEIFIDVDGDVTSVDTVVSVIAPRPSDVATRLLDHGLFIPIDTDGSGPTTRTLPGGFAYYIRLGENGQQRPNSSPQPQPCGPFVRVRLQNGVDFGVDGNVIVRVHAFD